VTSDGNLLIRRLRDEAADYRLMSRWLSDPRVLEFYGGRDRPLDEDAARARYRENTGDDAVTTGCIIEVDGRPIGYIQYYPWRAYPEDAEAIGLRDPDAFGIDLFIGEPDLWGRGIGTRTIDLLALNLFDERDATQLTLDPLTTNARAIRSYEKAGFRKVRVVRDTEMHEGQYRDLWLMVRTRPSADL
jgi:aminoglycoside 6'-N-acetyltransferase